MNNIIPFYFLDRMVVSLIELLFLLIIIKYLSWIFQKFKIEKLSLLLIHLSLFPFLIFFLINLTFFRNYTYNFYLLPGIIFLIIDIIVVRLFDSKTPQKEMIIRYFYYIFFILMEIGLWIYSLYWLIEHTIFVLILILI